MSTDSSKIQTCFFLFIAYVTLMMTRSDLSYALVDMIDQGLKNVSDVGLLLSTFSFAYGIGRFFGGMSMDYFKEHKMLLVGIVITSGLISVVMSVYDAFYVWVCLWALNAFVQSAGWPAMVKIMRRSFKKDEMGIYWSVISTATSFGSALMAILGTQITQNYGWANGLRIPGILSCIVGVAVYFGVPNKGIIDESQEEKDVKKETSSSPDVWKNLKEDVLFNINYWLLAFANTLSYVIRLCFVDWGSLELIENKGFTQIEAGATHFWFSIGGLVGSLTVGYFSDYFFKGERKMPLIIYTSGTTISCIVFFMTHSTSYLTNSIMLFMIGLFVHGPHTMLGLFAVEVVHPRSSGASVSVIGSITYLLSTVSGYPIALLISNYGWGHFHVVLVTSSVFMILCFFGIKINKDKQD